MQIASPVSIVIMPIVGSAAFGSLLRIVPNSIAPDCFSTGREGLVPRADDTMRPHPVWRFETLRRRSDRNDALTHGGRPDDARKAAETAHWQAIVEQMIKAGLAQQIDGAVSLREVVLVRGRGARSTPIYEIDELRRYVALYGSNPRLAGSFIEPVEYDRLMSRARGLSKAIAEGTATPADRELHGRLVKLLIQRIENQIQLLWPKNSESSRPARIIKD